jgi:hypothetical protein
LLTKLLGWVRTMYFCAKTACIGLTVSISMAVQMSSGYAFQLKASKARQEIIANAAAFGSEPGSKGASRGSLLTDNEVKHIHWCALKHPSYHPTDNTILSGSGNRVECFSPLSAIAEREIHVVADS